MDLQRTDVRQSVPKAEPLPMSSFEDHAAVAKVLQDLTQASRPLILAGGGLRSAQAVPMFRTVVERLGVPVVNSLMGVDVLPYGHPLRVGLIGTYGNRWANIALARADVLLVLGSRLDIRQTGADTEAFVSGRVIHHIDCDPGELNNRVTGCSTLVSGLMPFLTSSVDALDEMQPADPAEWQSAIADLRAQWPDTDELSSVPGINPNAFLHRLSRAGTLASAYVADVGQHQMWAAQSLEVGEDQRFITSGGMGAMGSGLPLAVGAAIACGSPVVLVAGDGGFQLNIQELQAVARNRLPVKIVILNNRCHGMVRQFQESYFDSRYQSTVWGYSAPDFAAVAAAYGIETGHVDAAGEVDEQIEAVWRDPAEPYLLEVANDTCANAYPKIAFGHPISEMEPFVAPKAMEST
jgi:acetolactate synthase-1/2/3 large subunit